MLAQTSRERSGGPAGQYERSGSPGPSAAATLPLSIDPSTPPADPRALRGDAYEAVDTVHEVTTAVASAVVSASGVPPSTATARGVPMSGAAPFNALTRTNTVDA